MTDPRNRHGTVLDVLVVESDPHAAEGTVAALEAAGHVVHRCHDDGSHGFPCRGVTDPTSCPVAGDIDVAVAVRRRVHPRPTRLEDGLRCALRVGIPVIERGPDILDPFGPWVVRRVHADADVPLACVDVAAGQPDPLAQRIAEELERRLLARGLRTDGLRCAVVRNGGVADVHIDGAGSADRGLVQTLAVRALDVVRAAGHTFRGTNVHVHGTT